MQKQKRVGVAAGFCLLCEGPVPFLLQAQLSALLPTLHFVPGPEAGPCLGAVHVTHHTLQQEDTHLSDE